MSAVKPRVSNARRTFIKQAVAVAGGVAAGAAPWLARARGPDAGRPEKRRLTLGFIPLTDCASLVMAQELGLFAKYGLEVRLSREASWAAIRDKLVLGDLDAAHALYGLIYGIHLGLSGDARAMAVLMGLNQNGQGIALSRALVDAGVGDGEGLRRRVAAGGRDYRFAQTFPTGTHALWLYYWLAAHDIDPLRDVKTVVVPPPRMVAAMQAGRIDGFCAGEPWVALAAAEGIGPTVMTTQAIWPNHPEKVLGCTRAFVEACPNTARALVMALLEAARYVDVPANRARVAAVIAGEAYVDAPVELILGRFTGRYDDGRGRHWDDPNPMRFHGDGDVNFPYLSHGMWFLNQHQRWGLIGEQIDTAAVAAAINQVALYREAAGALGVGLPAEASKCERLFDGRIWNPAMPRAYLEQFAIRA